MNRALLALGALVLVAVIGIYVVVLRGGDGSPQTSPAPDPKFTQADPGKPSLPVQQRAASGSAAADPSAPAAREYVVDGVRVRDHRSGDHPPIDLAPPLHAPEGRRIPSELTSTIAQKLRAVVAECAASVPGDVRGEKPRAEGEILIAIKNRQATVTGGTIQMRDVNGASADAVKQCIEQKSIGVAAPSGDEPDVERYAITLSLRLP